MRPATPHEIRNDLKSMQEQFEVMCDVHALRVKYIRSTYEALLREGFNEPEALTIILERGYTV